MIQSEARLVHPIGVGNPVPHSASNFCRFVATKPTNMAESVPGQELRSG